MKKLSNITESIWSDLQDRSAGITVRKEDDVNNMDLESFWLYIIKNFKDKVMVLDKSHYLKDYDMDIVVDPTNDVVIFGSYVKDELVNIRVILKTKVKDVAIRKIIDASPDNFRWIRIHNDNLELELNDGKVTNQTFVNLIEFFLNNQQVFESIWSDIQDRSSGEVVRDEDKFNPDYTDFGPNTTVYWAIDNLEIDGKVKFYFDDVKDYNNNGWRLPTIDEVNQLKWNIRISWYDECRHLEFDSGNELKLKTYGSGGFHMWTKEINPKFPSGAYAYGFDNSYNFDISNFNKSINKLFVFLVKDKKITESIWSDLQDRSSGETIRKEDAFISNIKDMKPVDLGSNVPVYFADIDLEVNDENEFTWEEVLNFLPEIEKTGWKLLCGPKGVQHIFYNGNIRPTLDNDDNYEKQWIQGKGGILRSKETKEELHFYADNRYGSINYWCVDDRYEPGNLDTASCKRIPGKTRYFTQRGFEVIFGCVININNFMANSKCRIRLVKDK